MTTHARVDAGTRTHKRLVDMPEMWGAISIAVVWLAVLFVGIFAGDFVSADLTRIPSVIFVALFACIATAWVGKRAFGPHAD